MGSISETKFVNLLDRKPYITRAELLLVLEKTGRNLDKKILQLLKKKELISLKKGLYVRPTYLALQKGKTEEFIANILYSPSYLSLEYVLSKEGCIPEAVNMYTSVTSKTTRLFTNAVGTFSYRHLKTDLFTGYTLVRFNENYQVKIATKAKAIFDYLYYRVLPQTKIALTQELFEDLRFNWETVSKADYIEFAAYARNSGSAKMQRISRVLERRLL